MAVVAVPDRVEPAGAGVLRHPLGDPRPAAGRHRGPGGRSPSCSDAAGTSARACWPTGPAPRRAGSASTWGLSLRLQRPSLLAWMVAAVLMGLVLGSVADSVSGFIDTPAMAEFLERLGGRQAPGRRLPRRGARDHRLAGRRLRDHRLPLAALRGGGRAHGERAGHRDHATPVGHEPCGPGTARRGRADRSWSAWPSAWGTRCRWVSPSRCGGSGWLRRPGSRPPG